MLRRMLARYMPEVEILAIPTLEEAISTYVTRPFQTLIANVDTAEQMADYSAQRHLLPPHVPLLLSTFSTTSDNALLLGVTDYLVKPITRKKLTDVLEAITPPVYTILIADDDPDVFQLYFRMLSVDESHTYRLLQATTGEDALYLLQTRHPDVLLLDLAMPQMDGYQLLAVKNDDPTIRDIPVLIVSAQDLIAEPLTSASVVAMRREGISVPELFSSLANLSEVLGLTFPAQRVRASKNSPRVTGFCTKSTAPRVRARSRSETIVLDDHRDRSRGWDGDTIVLSSDHPSSPGIIISMMMIFGCNVTAICSADSAFWQRVRR